MCTVLLPPGDNPIAVNRCIISYRYFCSSWECCWHVTVSTLRVDVLSRRLTAMIPWPSRVSDQRRLYVKERLSRRVAGLSRVLFTRNLTVRVRTAVPVFPVRLHGVHRENFGLCLSPTRTYWRSLQMGITYRRKYHHYYFYYYCYNNNNNNNYYYYY